MIKLVFGNKNKIIKCEQRSFQQINKSIKLNFPDAPFDYSLSYLDEDKDEICLNSEDDLSNMLNSKAKIYKIYIKQTLSQTIVIDVQRSEFIEPSFDNISVIHQDKKDFILDKHFVKEMLRQTTAVKVELNPIQKIHTQVVSVTYQETLHKIQEEPSKLKTSRQQQNKQLMIPVMRQKGRFQEIFIQKSFQIRPVKLYISPEQRVFSKVSDSWSKIHKKEQQMTKIVHRAKIVEKSRDFQKRDESLAIHGVICYNCKDQFGILGIRYQCILCNHFNLCSECEIVTEHGHALLKVKRPQQALNDSILIEKLKQEVYVPQQEKLIPSDYFIPSIDKQNAHRTLETARQSYEHGFVRSKNLLEQLFFKMEMSHKNPYQMMKPIEPLKIQTVGQKAQHLSDLVSISYNQAMRFVNQYPATLQKQKIVQQYFYLKK